MLLCTWQQRGLAPVANRSCTRGPLIVAAIRNGAQNGGSANHGMRQQRSGGPRREPVSIPSLAAAGAVPPVAASSAASSSSSNGNSSPTATNGSSTSCTMQHQQQQQRTQQQQQQQEPPSTPQQQHATASVVAPSGPPSPASSLEPTSSDSGSMDTSGYWDLLVHPDTEATMARAKSASDASLLRRKGHLKEQDKWIEYIRHMHETHTCEEAMYKMERWIAVRRLCGGWKGWGAAAWGLVAWGVCMACDACMLFAPRFEARGGRSAGLTCNTDTHTHRRSTGRTPCAAGSGASCRRWALSSRRSSWCAFGLGQIWGCWFGVRGCVCGRFLVGGGLRRGAACSARPRSRPAEAAPRGRPQRQARAGADLTRPLHKYRNPPLNALLDNTNTLFTHLETTGGRVPGVRLILPPQPAALHPPKLCGAAAHPQHRAGACLVDALRRLARFSSCLSSKPL